MPQNLYEFWAMATRTPGQRPAGQNGLGLTTAQATQWIGFFQRRFILLPDRVDLPTRWHALVNRLGIRGFWSHARLATVMQSYGISRLLTFKGSDFKDLPVTAVDPAAV